MTEFILRIFFSGLIAFVPNSDGTQMNVVLVNASHEHTLPNGDAVPPHHPLLLARGTCSGDCTTPAHSDIATFLFSNKMPPQAIASLDTAISGGAAWELSSSDLHLEGPTGPLTLVTGVRKQTDGVLSRVPQTVAEREDFTWVPSVSDVAPATNGFKTALTLDEPPPACTVAARLKLNSGKLFTYSLVKIDAKARPVYFRDPAGDGPEGTYTQAVANWVVAEIHVPGDSVQIVEQSFNNVSAGRTMTLRPQNGVVEVALLNLPPFVRPAANAPAPLPAPGEHFQLFYDLVKRPPAYTGRLVPHLPLSLTASEPQTDWASLHPREGLTSLLLEDLGMNPRGRKSPYDLAICPIIRD